MDNFTVENIDSMFIWAGLGFAFILLLLFMTRRRGFRRGAFYPKNSLLNKTELYFYNHLKKYLGGKYMICFKVRLADVIDCSRSAWKAGGHKISAKHIDFVLIDPKTTKILCAIELDDKPHKHKDEAEKDSFVNNVMSNAGVPLLRFPVKRNYSKIEIKDAISLAVA